MDGSQQRDRSPNSETQHSYQVSDGESCGQGQKTQRLRWSGDALGSKNECDKYGLEGRELGGMPNCTKQDKNRKENEPHGNRPWLNYSSKGSAKMKLGRLNHVGVATPSIERSVAMYRDVLGATQVGDPSDLPALGDARLSC